MLCLTLILLGDFNIHVDGVSPLCVLVLTMILVLLLALLTTSSLRFDLVVK